MAEAAERPRAAQGAGAGHAGAHDENETEHAEDDQVRGQADHDHGQPYDHADGGQGHHHANPIAGTGRAYGRGELRILRIQGLFDLVESLCSCSESGMMPSYPCRLTIEYPGTATGIPRYTRMPCRWYRAYESKYEFES